LWQPYDRSPEIYRRRTLAVQLLRFVLSPQPPTISQRAPGTLPYTCAPSPAITLSAWPSACFRSNNGSKLLASESHIHTFRHGRNDHHPACQYQRRIQSP
jgi:hypothetical protein